MSIFNFNRKPRAVSEIISGFTKTISELEERVKHDEAGIQHSRDQIMELQSDIAQLESSRCEAIAFSSRIKDMLGLK